MPSSDDSNNKPLPYSVEITNSSEHPGYYGLRFTKNSVVLYEFSEICDSFVAVSELLNCFEEFDVDESHICDVVSDFVQLLYFNQMAL